MLSSPPSSKRIAMLGDEFLDRQRRAAPDCLHEVIGPLENTVGVIDGDLAQIETCEMFTTASTPASFADCTNCAVA